MRDVTLTLTLSPALVAGALLLDAVLVALGVATVRRLRGAATPPAEA